VVSATRLGFERRSSNAPLGTTPAASTKILGRIANSRRFSRRLHYCSTGVRRSSDLVSKIRVLAKRSLIRCAPVAKTSELVFLIAIDHAFAFVTVWEVEVVREDIAWVVTAPVCGVT
jgi:hypothetical protein